jgi:hypothetical protein
LRCRCRFSFSGAGSALRRAFGVPRAPMSAATARMLLRPSNAEGEAVSARDGRTRTRPSPLWRCRSRNGRPSHQPCTYAQQLNRQRDAIQPCPWRHSFHGAAVRRFYAQSDGRLNGSVADLSGIMYQPPPADFGLYSTTHSGRKGRMVPPRIGSLWRSISCFLPLHAR